MSRPALGRNTQKEQACSVKPVHRRPSVGPVADVGGHALVAGDADQGRHEAVTSVAANRRGESRDRWANTASGERERHLRVGRPRRPTADRRRARPMSLQFGRQTPRCEPERPGSDDGRSIRARKRLTKCLDRPVINGLRR